MDPLSSLLGLMLFIPILIWLWSCQSAAAHCARQLDQVILELRALRQASGPKP